VLKQGISQGFREMMRSSNRYIELYENITGDAFVRSDLSNINHRIETNVLNFLSTL
jgi:phosphoribosylaminoimidazole-succinocarboxamide synthase